jgi:hypothetical protein
MSPLFGPDAGRVQLTGTRLPGTIIGIETGVTHDDESTRFCDYAVEAGGKVYGIRQDLAPDNEIRLGMPVTLAVDGDAAVIEWGDSGTHRWKMLKNPPAPGIVDDLDGSGNRGAMTKVRRGTPVTVTLLDLTTRKVALGLGESVDGSVRAVPDGGEPIEATIQGIHMAPGYAAHLLEVGATLPGWIRSGLLGQSIVIDWQAAANADPGVGRPPAPLPGPGGALGPLAGGSAGTGSGTDPIEDPDPAPLGNATPAIRSFTQMLLAKAGEPQAGDEAEGGADIVSWETFLDIQHQIDWAPLKKKAIEEYAVSRGVPAGEWPAAQRRWQLRMGSDMALMQEYGVYMSKP